MCKQLSCQEWFAQCVLLVLTVLIIGLLLIHMRLSEKGYMPDVDDAYTTMYQAFAGIYCGLYFLMFTWVMVRFCVTKRLCSFANFLFMFTSIAFIGVGSYIC